MDNWVECIRIECAETVLALIAESREVIPQCDVDRETLRDSYVIGEKI